MKKRKITEAQVDMLVAEKEKEYKDTLKIIKALSNNTVRNYDARIDFATKMFQLSTSSCKEARKFVNKCMSFANFYGDDAMISEEEWRKLNNTEDKMEEKTTNKDKKKVTESKKRISQYNKYIFPK